MVFGHDIMTWNGFVHPLKEKNAFDELPKNDRSRCLRAMDSITSMGRGSGRPGLATFFLGLVVLAGLNSGEQQFLICGTSSGWIVFVPLRSRLSCEKSLQAMLRYLAPYASVVGGVGALQRGVGTVQHTGVDMQSSLQRFWELKRDTRISEVQRRTSNPIFSGMEWDW